MGAISHLPKFDESIGGKQSIEGDVAEVMIEDGQLKQSGAKRIEKKIPDRYRLTKPSPHRICKTRHFTLVHETGHVVARCRSCSVGWLFIPGMHRLVNGSNVMRLD
jgi:hypothetical protein